MIKKTKKKKRLAVWLTALIVLLTLSGAASAETERGNLEERFDDEVTLTHQDVEYRLRSRMTTLVFVGAVKDEAAACYRTEMLVMLAVDDNRKLMTPVMIHEEILTEPIEIPFVLPDEAGVSLPDLDGVKERCETILQTVNELLPTEIAEHYVVLDLAGLEQIDGKQSDDYEDRMRAIKHQAERMSSGAISDLLGKLSGYLATDMKSGEFIRLFDKADRYDRLSMMRLETAESWVEGVENSVIYTPELFLEMAIETFFQEKTGW